MKGKLIINIIVHMYIFEIVIHHYILQREYSALF